MGQENAFSPLLVVLNALTTGRFAFFEDLIDGNRSSMNRGVRQNFEK